jgi:hypothetical protein
MQTNSETSLSATECADLRRVAGMMIPASEAFNIPGADDPIIFADIVASLGRDFGHVRSALAALQPLGGRTFADLDDVQGQAAVMALLDRNERAATMLGQAILQCYYRDDRVLTALGHEARSPFPKGHVLDQGDWSLLDVVHSRPRMWRDDRGA